MKRQRRLIIQPKGCEERATLGEASQYASTLKGLHLPYWSNRPSTLSGLDAFGTRTQGSSFLATLGLIDSTPSALPAALPLKKCITDSNLFRAKAGD